MHLLNLAPSAGTWEAWRGRAEDARDARPSVREQGGQELTIFHPEDEDKQLITMTQALIDMVQETFKTEGLGFRGWGKGGWLGWRLGGGWKGWSDWDSEPPVGGGGGFQWG